MDAGGKFLRGGCGLGAGAVIFCCCLTSLTLFLARWAVGGCSTGAEHLSSGPELQGQGPGLGEGQTLHPGAKSVKVLLTSVPELWEEGP